MGSFATVTPANFDLGPMRVTANGVDLGGTKGGVTVSPSYKVSDLMADQFGSSPIDGVISGKTTTVKMVLVETKLKDNWKVAFPHSKLVTSGPNKMIYFDNQVGAKLSDSAVELKLHPLSKGDADLSGDFKFFKAVAKSATEIKYGPEEQTGLEIEFMILPDTTSAPARYFIHGDPTIGLVAAAAGAPGFVGTGNGTMTSVSTGSKTKTENVVVTCIGTNGANKSAWKVVGSVSGHLGTVELTGGVGGTGVFVSDYLNFTLTDGGTDFVVGDAFTVATTSANYA